jgi:hypothetical protein
MYCNASVVVVVEVMVRLAPGMIASYVGMLNVVLSNLTKYGI